MIPVRLTLRNFMSYGDERTTLDFTGMHVACLSGDNGNGKSALLDAMTYALWGKTRASGSQASSEDDLVRLGAEEMEVTFEFRLGDDQYRVLRKRNRRTRTGDWQAQLCDANGAWRPVGGSSMRETERQLIRLLHMEYETFLNSAYLQQGHADEFTRQKPDARKRILADILDLSRYDRLEEMAKERRNEADLVLKDLEGEIRHYEARTAEEPALREKLAEQEAALTAWTEERATREAHFDLLRTRQAALDEKAQRLREREERLREVVQEVADWEEESTRIQARITQDAALIACKPVLQGEVRTLTEKRAQLERLEAEVGALHQARQSLEGAQGRLQLRRQEMQNALSLAEAECRRAEERAQQIVRFQTELDDLHRKRAEFAGASAALEAAQNALSTAQQGFAELSEQNRSLKVDIAEVEEVLLVLSKPKSACPICQTDLTGGRQEAVVLRQGQKLKDLKARLSDVQREGQEKKREVTEVQSRLTTLQERAQGEAALRARQKALTERLEESVAANAHAGEAQAGLETLRHRFEAADYGGEERKQITQLEAQIARLQTVALVYAEAQGIVRDLTARQVERQLAQADEAERAGAEMTAKRAHLEERIGKRREQIDAERKRLEALRTELADYDSVRLAVLDSERAVREAVNGCDAARAQVERCLHALEDCARARARVAEKKTERDKLAKDKQAYTELAAAFGKRGVQALIIDNALPEIQEEANRLLSRLTENALQISLQTLRQARTGSHQIETLDIQITDDAGTRPYEMYSGGEAFRVNFAIRIALSRLLARRAGARLQTLILDEGFGTQDARGRERLVEALEAVKEEFALILVISHIEELKDAFPTRIEITKTPAGSQINYLE